MTQDAHEHDREVQMLLSSIPAPGSPAEELHNQLRRHALDEFDRAVSSRPEVTILRRAFQKGRIIVTHPISRTLAAVAAALFVAVWLASPRQSIAFGDLLAPIIDAKSAKFKVTIKNDVQPKPMSATAYFLAPDRFRQEFTAPEAMVTIADFDAKKMTSLFPTKKEAMVFELRGTPAPGKDPTNNFFGNLRNTLKEYRKNKQGQVQELGEKDLDGRPAFGFRLYAGGILQTMWGDVETGRLIRIESAFNGPPKTEVVMSQFEFDVPLDAALFSADPPEGYEVTSIPMDVSPPTEEEFVRSLKRLSEATDGHFPAGLDTAGIAVSFAKLLKGKDKDKKAMMTEGAALGRGLMFATMLPVDAEAHYAGKGASLQGPKQPIFWYKPAESKEFRVIWSDLSTTEAQSAPEVPGAVRLSEGFPKPKSE